MTAWFFEQKLEKTSGFSATMGDWADESVNRGKTVPFRPFTPCWTILLVFCAAAIR